MKTITKLTVLVTALALMGVVVGVGARQLNVTRNQIGQVDKANQLVGKEVRNARSEDIGKLDDLVIDLESGRLLYAIIDVKGGLSGANKVAIPGGKFSKADGNLIANVDKANLANAPRFTKDRANELDSVTFAREIYQHFHQQTWWEGSDTTSSKNFGNVHTATQLMGANVKNVANEDFGKVKNLVVDVPSGRVLYVVFSPAGDLGANDTVYLMPPNAFTRGSNARSLVTGVDKSKLQGAPHFNSNKWPEVANPSYASQIYNYYGKQPYFQGGQTSPTSTGNQ